MESNKDDVLLVLWRIENFALIAGLSSFHICSPVIPTKQFGELDFFVEISHSVVSENIYIALNKCRKDDGPMQSHLDVEFGLIDKNGHEQFNRNYNFGIDPKINFRVPFMKRNEVFQNKEEFIPNGDLTLVCRARLDFSGLRTYIHTEIIMERSAFLWKIRNPCLDLSQRTICVEFDLIDSGFVLKCESLSAGEVNKNKNFLTFVIRSKRLHKHEIAMSASIQLCKQINAFPKVEEVFNINYKKNEWNLGSLDISDLTNNLHDVDLTCKFSISKGNFKSYVKEVFFPVKFQSGINTLKDAIGAVYEKVIQKYSPECRHLNHTDITVRTSNQETPIPAHKMILAARSPVIDEVLEKYIKQKRNWFHVNNGTGLRISAGSKIFKVYMDRGQDKAIVYNMSSRTLSQVMGCMYTDTVDITNMDDAILLYMAGTNFEFNLLINKSRDYLRTKVSLSTLSTLLTFAYQVEDMWIKNDFLNFIDKNRCLVFSSEAWNSSCPSFGDLKRKVLADLETNCRIFN